jgi:hypothetical protein
MAKNDAVSPEFLAQAEANARKVADLEVQLAQLKAHVGLVDAPAVSDGFPKHVYQAQDDPDPTQKDHPGWDTKQVGDQAAFDAAIAGGWQAAPGPYVYPVIEESVAVVRKVKRA